MARIAAFEGMSGTGKTTQLKLMKNRLDALGIEAHVFREPSGFADGLIKKYRSERPSELRDPYVEAFLFSADRRKQFAEEISPLLERDCLILMDRSKYAALGYQTGLPAEELKALNSFFPDPDLALFFVCEPEIAFARVNEREGEKQVSEELQKMHQLRENFEGLAASLPNSALIYCGGSEGAVFQQVRSNVYGLLGMPMKKIVFLDKDGVLVDNSKCPPIIPTDEIYPESLPALRLLKEQGYALHIVSNQSWIGKGLMSPAEVEGVFKRLVQRYADAGIEVDSYSYCPHTKDDGCECKKPGTGMFEQILERETGDVRASHFIGDDLEKDGGAGRRAGLNTIILGRDSENILEAARMIVAYGSRGADWLIACPRRK
ncbi:MAG: dTMP kinase [archaeon]